MASGNDTDGRGARVRVRPSLLDTVASVDALREAWEDVASRCEPGEQPASSLRRFRDDIEGNLLRLRDELRDGAYSPRPLHHFPVAKPDGGYRELAIPSVRDRVVERAVLTVVTPHADQWLGPAAFAYRPGLGVADAVQAVVRLREDGLRWVLRADVEDCFPSIPRGLALRLLTALLPDDSLTELIGLIVNRAMITRAGLRQVSGLAQGTSLAPLMANLVLARLDNALLDQGFALVRYADDFAVGCSTSAETAEAARVASAALREMGMALSADKTAGMSFDQGFCFLGEDFGPRYPPLAEDQRLSEPLRRVVYVALQGSRVRVSQGKVVVESRDCQQALSVPMAHVSRIVCFGSVGLSAGARSWAFERGIEVAFLSRRGGYLGQLTAGASSPRINRLRAQAALSSADARVLQFAREVVAAKIRHQITLVQRFGRRDRAEDLVRALGQMRAMAAMLPMAQSAAEAMGLEGAAARCYFGVVKTLLPASSGFAGRTRRPPMDVVNSALSYGYALLLAEAVSALVAAGLDPGFGMLHAEDDRRPSLALDLMEEFRPLIVDQVVVKLVRGKSLASEHGMSRTGEAGVWLTKAGKEILVEAYERRMLTLTSGALPGFSGSLRRHLYRQAERIAAFISDDLTVWTGLSWR